MSNMQTTTDINKNESAEPHMRAETYRAIMRPYKEPEENHQVTLRLHTRAPDFSVLNFQDGIRCFPCYGPTIWEQREPVPGAGYCDGNHYGERPKHPLSTSLTTQFWQTQISKAAWDLKVARLRMMEEASIERVIDPPVPHICGMCKDMFPERGCKLTDNGMQSLCKTHNKQRGVIIKPENRRQNVSYWNSLNKRLDDFERRNRAPKIWRNSTLPTFNRNDGELDVKATMEAGKRVYKNVDPHLVPEVAYSHDRTEDSSGYEECAFPDDWRGESAESSGSGNDDYTYIDGPETDVKTQVLEAPKPVWVSVTRQYLNWKRVFVGFRKYQINREITEFIKVWKPNGWKYGLVWRTAQGEFVRVMKPVDNGLAGCKGPFMLTVEERKSVVRIELDQVVTRAEEYPTLINVNTPEMFAKEVKTMSKLTGRLKDELIAEGTMVVKSSTVITKKEREYYRKRDSEKQKQRLTGYLVSSTPKHAWPIRSKRAAAPAAATAAAGV